MAFKLEAATDNEAFQSDPRHEMARILRAVADSLESGREGGHCLDLNGNRVGSWDLEA
jgi:hypothetical protein